MPGPVSSFDALNYDNRFVAELPADPVLENDCRPAHVALYSRVSPVSVPRLQLLVYAADMMSRLGLADAYAMDEEFARTMSGNQLAKGMDPYASCYGGYQFGQWAGQLGDGRAINIGETVNAQVGRWALQLKGAGPTPNSRRADSYAVLR